MFFLKSRQPRSIERKVCVESAVELLDLCGGKQGKQHGGKGERATTQYEQVPPVANAAVVVHQPGLDEGQQILGKIGRAVDNSTDCSRPGEVETFEF